MDIDVFVLQSESETTKDENMDQNKNLNEKIQDQSAVKKKKKHHHHHHHHHKSKSKTKSEEDKNDIKKTTNLPVVQNETFCLNSSPKDEEDIVNFKFELSDSSEFPKENNQSSSPTLTSNPPPVQNNETQKEVQMIETPKTEIKASSIQITDLNPIENKEINETFQLDEPSQKVDLNLNIEKKEKNSFQTPKKIQLKTNKKTTNSLFEYKILSFLDQSLNHLSQDFLEDFQFYVKNAFSYDKIFDEFILSLNSEIQDIFYESNSKNEIRFIDEIDNITEKLTKNMPHLPKSNNSNKKEFKLEEKKEFEFSEFLRIQENFLSSHQYFNEMQSYDSENSIIQSDDEIKNQYDRLKSAQLKRIELESISEVQSERLNRLEEQLKEIQEYNESFMKKKFYSNFEGNSNFSLKNSIQNLIDIMNRDENKCKNSLNLDKFKKSLNNYLSNRDQFSYEIDCFENYAERSFCPLFSQMNNLKSFNLLSAHRKENIICE